MTNKVLYIGRDKIIWESLQKVFKETYSHHKFDYHQLVFDKGHVDLFFEINKIEPDLIFLDFSDNSGQAFLLAKTIRYQMTTKDITIVGLHNKHEITPKLLQDCHLYKILINHIKTLGDEEENIAYHACRVAFSPISIPPQYLKIETNLESEVKYRFKIGYLDLYTMLVETDLDVAVGEDIHFKTKIFSNTFLSRFKVLESTTSNLYYPFERSLKLAYVLADGGVMSDPTDLASSIDTELRAMNVWLISMCCCWFCCC